MNKRKTVGARGRGKASELVVGSQVVIRKTVSLSSLRARGLGRDAGQISIATGIVTKVYAADERYAGDVVVKFPAVAKDKLWLLPVSYFKLTPLAKSVQDPNAWDGGEDTSEAVVKRFESRIPGFVGSIRPIADVKEVIGGRQSGKAVKQLIDAEHAAYVSAAIQGTNGTGKTAGRRGCSKDTDGDGNCGRPLCPECGVAVKNLNAVKDHKRVAVNHPRGPVGSWAVGDAVRVIDSEPSQKLLLHVSVPREDAIRLRGALGRVTTQEGSYNPSKGTAGWVPISRPDGEVICISVHGTRRDGVEFDFYVPEECLEQVYGTRTRHWSSVEPIVPLGSAGPLPRKETVKEYKARLKRLQKGEGAI